jgi:16S rRNA (cytosine1407-C5)-methyltransferase
MKRKKKNLKAKISEQELISDQLERFRSLLLPGEFDKLVKIIDQPITPSLRINPLKATPSAANDLSEKYGWEISQIPFCSSGFRVMTNEGPSLSETIEYKNGWYYIQEASSMLPVELFSISNAEDMLTLDLAASPGGKTTHLVSRMDDQGLILANDSSQGRIQALKIVLQNWGAENSAITRFPGESFGQWFPETFDRVLIDAPCSMQGLRTTETHPPRPVTTSETRHLAQRQAGLLASAIQAAQIGGEVVYSTCTLAREEDEEVIATILSRYGSAIQLENAQTILPIPAPGVSLCESSKDMERTIRLWPHRYDTAGFFACKFKKIRSIEIENTPPPSHSMEKAGFFELSSREKTDFSSHFEDQFGFPMEKYLDKNRRTLIRRDNKVFVFPGLLLERFGSLPVQSAGLQVCTIENEVILPTFEWVTRFGLQCELGKKTLTSFETNEWLKGKDLPSPEQPGKSTSIYFVLNQEGQILGRGKKVQQILKNLDYRRYL